MKIDTPDERRERLMELAKDLGVSRTSLATSTGIIEENILIERIEQRYTISLARRSWILALMSAIASVLSALAAWVAIYWKNL